MSHRYTPDEHFERLVIIDLQAEIAALRAADAAFDAEVDLCYLCPPGTLGAETRTHCIHCQRPICVKHDAGAAAIAECGPRAAAQRGQANQSLFLS